MAWHSYAAFTIGCWCPEFGNVIEQFKLPRENIRPPEGRPHAGGMDDKLYVLCHAILAISDVAFQPTLSRKARISTETLPPALPDSSSNV